MLDCQQTVVELVSEHVLSLREAECCVAIGDVVVQAFVMEVSIVAESQSCQQSCCLVEHSHV